MQSALGWQVCPCLPKHCPRAPTWPAAVRLPWWGCSCPSCGLEFGGSPVLAAASYSSLLAASMHALKVHYRFSPAPLIVGIVKSW